jgi:hypothetical protein
MRVTAAIVMLMGLSWAPVASPLALQEPPPISSPATENALANPQAPAAEKSVSGDQAKDEPPNQTKSELKSDPNGEPKEKPAARRRVRVQHRAKRPPAPEGAPRKIVVREGGVDEPATQIVTDMAPEEASRQRENTEHLLNSTGDALKRLATRTLDAERQETVLQIRTYVGAARSALKEGDISRASTLALKANLLADDLEKKH